MNSNLLERLTRQANDLSKSEFKVAQVIIDNPNDAIRSSIATLAKAAKVSEPTVNRFCRSLDCSGFPDFKLKLAQCLATGTPYVNRNVEPNDGAQQYSDKIINATLTALTDAQNHINPEQIDKAVLSLQSARKIEFYGLGGSGAVAKDAVHKFFRLNIPVGAQTDMLMQRMSAAGSSKGDAIIFISNTGATIPVVESAQIARTTGATTIAITSPNSPLANACEIVLSAESSENTEIFTPMTSRIIHLVIVDILATGVALAKGENFQEHLKKVKEALSNTRFPS